jgi:hypothetical protein
MQGQSAIKTPAVTHPPGPHPAGDTSAETSHRLSVLAELETRIHELEHIAEEEFGSFTWFDWLLCIGGAVLLPYLCYVWFWP